MDKNILVSVLTGQESLPSKNTDKKSNQDFEEKASNIRHKSESSFEDKRLEALTFNQDGTESRLSVEESLERETAVENESKALTRQREGRQREMALAQQSRVRMSQLISEEEIQEVVCC